MTEIQTFTDIYNYFKKSGKIKNLREFAELTGNSYTYLSELKNNRKPMSTFFILSINEKLNTDFVFGNKDEMHNGYDELIMQDEYKEILLQNEIRNIPFFRKADGVIQVRGNSMNGYINNGDWVVVKKVINKDVIIYNEPYLLVTKTDNFKTIKFVKESLTNKESFLLVPYNIENFAVQEILKVEVDIIYMIMGLFRIM
jgi:hypothetical protein